uniref:Uncharacterized protein n=1 Tax=Anguilla anguilla TaxID=7936 RepID=A0A0E9SHU9_ANGAN
MCGKKTCVELQKIEFECLASVYVNFWPQLYVYNTNVLVHLLLTCSCREQSLGRYLLQ